MHHSRRCDQDRTLMCHLHRVGEARFPHEGGIVSPELSARARFGKADERETPSERSCAPPKQAHAETAWSQHTPYLVQVCSLLILLEVVEHEG